MSHTPVTLILIASGATRHLQNPMVDPDLILTLCISWRKYQSDPDFSDPDFSQMLLSSQLRTFNIHGPNIATMKGPQAASVLHAFECIRYRQELRQQEIKTR